MMPSKTWATGRNATGDQPTLKLPAILDLMAAAPLRLALLAAIDGQAPITLDGAEVERFSSPCAQVLVAAARTADASSVAIRLQQPSANLLRAMDDLGVRSALADWMS